MKSLIDMNKKFSGTLALDLGNTNTVIAFQCNKEKESILIEIPNMTSTRGVIPTAVWYEDETKEALIGLGALRMKNHLKHD